MKKKKQMFKTMFSKTDEWILPMLGSFGGAGTGISYTDPVPYIINDIEVTWWTIYGPTVQNAIIFALVGTIIGFAANKILPWAWSSICKGWRRLWKRGKDVNKPKKRKK